MIEHCLIEQLMYWMSRQSSNTSQDIPNITQPATPDTGQSRSVFKVEIVPYLVYKSQSVSQDDNFIKNKILCCEMENCCWCKKQDEVNR